MSSSRSGSSTCDAFSFLQVDLDGSWSDMPAGFPELEAQGSKQMIRVRFPAFTSSAVYDPQIDLSLDGVEVEGGINTSSANPVSALTSLLLISLVGFLF